MSTSYPATRSIGKLRKLLQSNVPSVGRPAKVDAAWLARFGINNANDVVLAALKFIGIVDEAGVPTAQWDEYRQHGQSRTVMARLVRSAYHELFNDFPDAHRRSEDELRTYFSSVNTKGSANHLSNVVGTFRALCDLADFDTAPTESDEKPEPATPPESTPANPVAAGQDSREDRRAVLPIQAPAININIQLQLPETDNAEVYDRFFEALRKHLLDLHEQR